MAGMDIEPEGDIHNPESLDCQQLGFMCGLEIHQQLATGKLHSRERGQLFDVTADTIPKHWHRTNRRLRAPKGESGRVDVAARFEEQRKRTFQYVQTPNAGLIELDEAPPLPIDEDALDITLTVSALLNAQPIPCLQTMRKTVVDGSNTSGFQRTTLVATAGKLETDNGPVGIDVICLEEDSARKLDTIAHDNGTLVIYNLDRLGTPLIEIATAPDVISPHHAKETAKQLGSLLRRTRRVRRGLGSIRQDLNVSIGAGDRVEIKGCQDLEWIPTIIRLEMVRQLHFYRLANTLRALLSLPSLPPHRNAEDHEIEAKVREAVDDIFSDKAIDVTDVFSKSTSTMIQNGLKKGDKMMGVRLPRLAGYIGSKTLDTNGAQLPRLGRELAGAAKLAGVQGIFHSDELPAYGIEHDDIDGVRLQLGLEPSDGFALCLAAQWQAELALEAVIARAKAAWHRIPKEVRNVVVKKGSPEDGTTSPMRPLPGGSRMYPETDIPNTTVGHERWVSLKTNLPLDDIQRLSNLLEYGVSDDQAGQLLAKESDEIFIQYIGEQSPKFFASLMLDYEGTPPELLSKVGTLYGQEALAKEHIENVLKHFSSSPNTSLDEISGYCELHNLAPASAGDLSAIIDTVLMERKAFIEERGMGAMGPLMGVVMQASGGADGKLVSSLLKEAIQRMLE